MLQESAQEPAGRWPLALQQKDWNNILKFGGQREIEKRYGREVQTLCRTPCFGAATTDEMPGRVNKTPLEEIEDVAKKEAPLISSMVLSVGPTTSSRFSSSNVLSMKLVAILVILCRFAHRNNSNYFPLLVALYMYSSGARVDAITLLNPLGLLVSYPVLLRKLANITATSQKWIKQQATNCQLVGTWDNFEFRENVHGERVGDVVKFRSITMALWIRKGWRIPKEGLHQTMWNPTGNLLDTLALTTSIFGQASSNYRAQCTRHHRFAAFIAAFPDNYFLYSASMPKIDIINCEKEGAIEVYPFAPSMASESTTAGNISVFEDLNIKQLGLEKEDPRWKELLTIW